MLHSSEVEGFREGGGEGRGDGEEGEGHGHEPRFPARLVAEEVI